MHLLASIRRGLTELDLAVLDHEEPVPFSPSAKTTSPLGTVTGPSWPEALLPPRRQARRTVVPDAPDPRPRILHTSAFRELLPRRSNQSAVFRGPGLVRARSRQSLNAVVGWEWESQQGQRGLLAVTRDELLGRIAEPPVRARPISRQLQFGERQVATQVWLVSSGPFWMSLAKPQGLQIRKRWDVVEGSTATNACRPAETRVSLSACAVSPGEPSRRHR